METSEILAGGRVITLILCLLGATYLDIRIRRVPNDWWLSWSKPALFLLSLELLIIEADWMVWLTASAVVAYASTAVIGRPDLEDLKQGSIEDWIVTVWYAISAVGLLAGALTHGPWLAEALGFSQVACADCDPEKAIAAAWQWGGVLVIGAVILFIEICYQLRMLHGGADAKAMMFVALCLPNWTALPAEGIAMMPPALALLVWGALAFLVLPFMVFFGNLANGDAANWKMSWHARKLPLREIAGRHVWLLDEVMDTPSGEKQVVTRMRPRRGSRSEEDVEAVLAELAELGIERAWVTEKYPFMAFLLLGLLPMIVIGDPILTLLNALGLV